MRVLAMTTAVLLSCTVGPSLAAELEKAPAQPGPAAAPVLPDQTPRQAEQTRGQDKRDAEDVQIGRDWKAQGGNEAEHMGRAEPSGQDHQTVGRDWRTHPDDRERQ
ncbi:MULTISPECIES: hypothetical protein [Bradyrhizobium]|uniref:Secreted protein n=1 Tax=Bradyrhizobium vignae TaxID=1549949 RepID=A0A2U3Q572_9BRAD|nr:hypothetical protein [Bradyrhizobium vignae]MBP0109922.1 hypothetical protein [Bradyrhizobium vignae]SPP96552.1 exported protein of unknown function [Bradyrhizobium vignae]